MVRFPSNSSQKIIEKMVGFLKEKWIATMVSFLQIQAKRSLKKMVGFLR